MFEKKILAFSVWLSYVGSVLVLLGSLIFWPSGQDWVGLNIVSAVLFVFVSIGWDFKKNRLRNKQELVTLFFIIRTIGWYWWIPLALAVLLAAVPWMLHEPFAQRLGNLCLAKPLADQLECLVNLRAQVIGISFAWVVVVVGLTSMAFFLVSYRRAQKLEKHRFQAMTAH